MKRSKFLLSLVVIGFVATMVTNVEGQLFRRANCCGCQPMSYSVPTVRYFQPRIMNYTRPAMSYGRQVYAQPSMNYQPAQLNSGNCGCAGSSMVGTPMMGGSVMNGSIVSSDGSVLSVNGTGVAGSVWDNDLEGGTADQTCLTTRQSCYDGCASSCGNNLAACRAHCDCIYLRCEACKKGLTPPNCATSPRPGCQAAQPDPCPISPPPMISQ